MYCKCSLCQRERGQTVAVAAKHLKSFGANLELPSDDESKGRSISDIESDEGLDYLSHSVDCDEPEFIAYLEEESLSESDKSTSRRPRNKDDDLSHQINPAFALQR